jgi:hypothetical protein
MATLRNFESSGTTWQVTRRKSPKDLGLLVSIHFLNTSNRLILIIDTVCVLCEALSESLQIIQGNVSPLPRLTHFPTLFLKSSPPLPDGRTGTGWRSSSRDTVCRTSGNMAWECTVHSLAVSVSEPEENGENYIMRSLMICTPCPILCGW